MYSYIKGTLERRTDDMIVVENNGIGYEIQCPFMMSSSFGPCGEQITVYIYQSVKEDDISLFGFTSREEKEMFIRLLTVSSVGPKVAMSVCSALKPDKLAIAVLNNDIKALTAVKGLGKKTAERIILELRDKFRKEEGKSLGAASASLVQISSGADADVINDATEALVFLGYKEDDARSAVAAAYTDGINVEDLVKASLKKMLR